MIIWLTILGMAAVTLFTRITPLLVLRGELPSWLIRWLNFVPVAVFTALIIPALVMRGEAGSFTLDSAIPAGMMGGLVAWKTHNVLLTIVAGMGLYWLLRLGGL